MNWLKNKLLDWLFDRKRVSRRPRVRCSASECPERFGGMCMFDTDCLCKCHLVNKPNTKILNCVHCVGKRIKQAITGNNTA